MSSGSSPSSHGLTTPTIWSAICAVPGPGLDRNALPSMPSSVWIRSTPRGTDRAGPKLAEAVCLRSWRTTVMSVMRTSPDLTRPPGGRPPVTPRLSGTGGPDREDRDRIRPAGAGRKGGRVSPGDYPASAHADRLQEALGDGGVVGLLGGDRVVQLQQRLGGQLRVDRIEGRADRRGQRGLVDERDDVLRGEVELRVGERDQLVRDDLRGGGEHVGGLDLAALQRRQRDRAGGVERVEGLERQAVVGLQAGDAVTA